MKQYKHIDILYSEYEKKKAVIQKRLEEFTRVKPDQYFYELLFCLMTPQSSAVNALKAQKKFEEMDFLRNNFNPENILRNSEHYIRFHKTKSRWILEMKLHFEEISSIVRSNNSAEEKREWLVKNVKGLSLKEAAHFLRNIGLNGSLTILDRHILKNLKHHAVLRALPITLTKKKYLFIEKKFQAFAETVGISVNEIDLLFWSKEAGEIVK